MNSRLAAGVTGYVLTRAGRLGEADAVFARLLSRPFSQPQEQTHTKLRLGMLRSAQGRHAEAQELTRDAAAFYSKSTPATNYAVALAALVEVQIEGGLTKEAHDSLTESKALFEKMQLAMSPDRADVLVNLARAQIAVGRTEDAVRSAEQAAAFGRSFDPANRNTGMALLWHAYALHAAGHGEQAAEPLRQARAILRTTGLPSERALLERTEREMRAAPRPTRP